MSGDGTVRITKDGRAATIHYGEPAGSCAFDAELGGGNVLLVICAPPEPKWSRRLPWAAGRRTEILETVAKQVVRQESRGSKFVVGETGSTS